MSKSELPDAGRKTALALVHEGWDHLRLQRPMAAWASWQQALRVEPDDRAATEALTLLDSADELPPSARAIRRFRSPTEETRRAAWSSAFEGRDLGDLDAAAEVFARIAAADRGDSAAWFNLGLCRAWRGANPAAIEALEHAVAIDAGANLDEAVASWMIAEVLRQGAGAEWLADDLSHFLVLDWSEELGDPLVRIARFAELAVPSAAPAVQVVEWLERPSGEPSGRASRVVAHLMPSPGALRVSSPDRESLELAEAILLDELGGAFRPLDRGSKPLPIRFMDASMWLFRFPAASSELDADAGAASSARRAAIEAYYERRWIVRPRIGLANSEGVPRSPAQAAGEALTGDAVALVKLAAVVNVREELASRPRMAAIVQGYPFDRLRRRLGLPLRDQASVEPGDVTSMGREELDTLDPAKLGDGDLLDAEAAAQPLCDAATLSRFAQAIDARGLGSSSRH